MDSKTTVVILSSEELNDKKKLEEYKSEITLFMDENLPENHLITIGAIKNIKLIEFLQDKGYEINKKAQSLPSLENSNNKLIRDNDIVIFFNCSESLHVSSFIDYARDIDNKDIKILNLNSK